MTAFSKSTFLCCIVAIGAFFASKAPASVVIFDENFTGLTDGSVLGSNGPWSGSTPITVDSNSGTGTLVAGGSFITTNWFGGQPVPANGDTVLLTSTFSVNKSSNTNAGNAFTFGFRGGQGGGEFHPNDGISQAISYNMFSSGLLKGHTVGNNSNQGPDINVSAPSLGLDILNGDTESDQFRLITEANVINILTGTFSVTTRIDDLGGAVLGATGPVTIVDSGVANANGALQFAIRGANSNYDSVVFTQLRAEIIAAIPEPSGAIMFTLAMFGFAFRQRKI